MALRFTASLLGLGFVAAALGDNRVLVIGVDGAGGNDTQQVATPNLDALIAAGVGRYDALNEGALTANPPSGYGASGVNWSTVLTGVGGPTHGVSDNSFSGNNFDQFPSFFHYVKQQDPTKFTAAISSWNPINTNIVADVDSDLEFGGVGDNAIRDSVVDLLTNGNPHAVFVHFDQVDGAGHSGGWGSATYRTAIQNVDGLIGDIRAALDARPGVMNGTEDWLILVASDHGGEGFSHFASQGPINWEVPLIISGPSLPDGTSIQQPTLRDIAARPFGIWVSTHSCWDWRARSAV